ncbi:PH domain-containing protein [Desertihabitans brevis]|uniref:PH domain-containing protein n=1 Tax=Desertihabitans brevis TaxID=2268447 RepID=A0A367YQN9_9ACTN|nr:PH domain-containing protein [Desertihabitans brevis]RCK68206.1 PH domain-containing protein [Desertihabitans brevis]
MVCRPRVLLVFASSVSVLFVAACLAGWSALGAELRAQFTVLQVATLLIFLAWIVGLMMAMALSVVVVDGTTVKVRNGLITRRYRTADVRAVRFRDGDPWAYLVLHETDAEGAHRQRQLLAIQTVDRGRARDDAARLRELIRSRR